MPAKIEWYKIENGKSTLEEEMLIEKFSQVGSGNWVPAEGRDARIMTTGPTIGRAYTGKSMELDTEHSSWNSIESGALFTAKSLPAVNVEKDGWKCDYPAALLSDIKVSLGMPATTSYSMVTRIALEILTIIPLLALIFFWIRRKIRTKHNHA